MKHVGFDDLTIFSERVDVFCPCAIGDVLNPKTIPLLKCKIVCGAANNQLGIPERDAKLLKERNIPYVVDFLANRMGVVNCADEAYGRFYKNDPKNERHFDKNWDEGIWKTVQRCLEEAKTNDVDTVTFMILKILTFRGIIQKNELNHKCCIAALKIAEEKSLVNHPIWPGRFKAIIKELVDEVDWANCSV